MGCCFSAGGHNPEAERRSSIDGAPPTSPPRVLDVETVKEVLLETPVVPKADERIKAMPPGNREWKPEAAPTAEIHRNSEPPRKDKEGIVSEVSEVSEMCSYSGSYSNAAVQDDEDGEVNQRPPPRKRRAQRGRGERVVARRMAAPSPERRRQVAPLRPVRGRGQPRNVAEENARRRSKSPVGRGEVDARRNAGGEKIPVIGEAKNGDVSAEEAESLENPVVSLECFIFL